MRILLVEDDVMIGSGIVKALQIDGFTVDWARDGRAGELALEAAPYGVMLLDLGLPRKDGLALLTECRRKGNRTAILIITARDAVADRVAALNSGADDYLVKPFHLTELIARIHALARRQTGQKSPELSSGSLRLNPITHEAQYRGEAVFLSPREFALLQTLMEAGATALSRADLEERLYGWDEEVGSNAVEVHIFNLRKKLGNEVIRNVRGVGYLVAGEP